MKIKQILLLLSLLALLGSITANAYDFKVSGVYYSIISNDQVRVTCQSWYRVSDRDNIPNGYTYHTYSTLIGYDEDDIGIYEYYYDYTTSDYSGTITIPSTVSYNGTTYKVVGINNYAFDNCEALSIDIQSTYIVGSRSIADEAFCNWKGRNFKGDRRQLTINCPYLGEAYWDDEEGSVYHLPFQNGYFTDLVLGENVTSIPERAFSRCLQLQTVTLPSTLTSIGESAFDTQPLGNNLNLIFSEIYEPFSFGSNAFWGVSSNCTLIVPVGTKDAYIAAGWTEDKFRGGILEGRKTSGNSGSCNSNNSVSWVYLSKEKTLIIYGTSRMGDYNNTSEKVPWYNFRNDIQKVVIKNGVTGIGAHAFEGCNNLTSVTIPNSVTSIGNGYAFDGCTSLSSLTIPNSVTYIGTDAFHNCTGLTSIEIPNSVTSIGFRAFGGCTGLSSIEIPNSVTSIGRLAFYGCESLTSVTIPNSVTSIGDGAFYRCSGLTSVTIPNSVTSIGGSAFESCSGLTSVTIPNSVTSIGSSAFSGCSSLTSVVSEIEEPFAFGSSAFYNIGSSCTLTVPYGTRDAYIAKGWTSSIFTGGIIEAPAPILIDFADANVKELCVANWDTNGDGDISEAEAAAVTDLGEVFKGNTEIISFDELQYFTGLTSIGDHAFDGCEKLTSLKIPNSVTTIGEWAIARCNSLTSIEIPNSVTRIGSGAFYGCSLTSIYIPGSVTFIGEWSPFGAGGLTSIIVDENNPVYDSRNNCNAIIETATNKLVVGSNTTAIPLDVTIIGVTGFSGNYSLLSIDIPTNIQQIDAHAFDWCISLNSVVCHWQNPISVGEAAFDNIGDACTLTIPYGTRDAYIAAGWTEEIFKGGIYYYNTLVDDDLETNDVSSYVLLQGLDDREEVPVNIVTDPVNANNHCIAIQSLDNPNHHWDTQFFVKSSRALGKDNRFRLRMKVRAEKEAMSILEAHRSPGDHAFSIGDFNFTTDWVEHTWNGTVSADGIMSIAISMNDLPESAIYYLDDIELIESYPADQSSALEGMLALMQSTNVYTKDAYDTYKAQYDYYKEKYDAGELTETVVNPYKVTGVRSGNDFDDFLLSAWTIGDQQCKDFDTPLIINTWSTEADGKENGSDMHVPFFEYWTADENSLDANTLEATLTDLENGTYTVEALVRVRIKNGASAPAYGITMSVNGGDAVDVCNGKTCGDGDEFLFDTFTATGVVSDGTLRIAFNVADNNNISWLAFKNVKYEKKESNEVAVTDISQLDNAIYIEPVEARCGTQVTLSVKMKNSVAVQTIQFDLYLPDGVSVIANDDDELITASKERIRKYQYFNSSIQSDGALRLLAQATTTNIAAGDGEICMVTVSIPEDMEEGEYPILFKEMRIVGNDNTNHTPSPNLIQTKLVVSSYIPGDANGDGEIDAIDFNIIGNHILGFGQSQFNEKAADINGDGEIDAIDFNMVANYILYGSYGGASASRVFIVEDDIDPS